MSPPPLPMVEPAAAALPHACSQDFVLVDVFSQVVKVPIRADTSVSDVCDHLASLYPELTPEHLYTCDGCELMMEDLLCNVCVAGEHLLLALGATDDERKRSTVLSSLGIFHGVPRTAFQPMPARVTSSSSCSLLTGQCILNPRIASSLKKLYIAVEGECHSSLTYGLRADSAQKPRVLTSVCVDTSSLKHLVVVGGKSNLNSVGDLVRWVRARMGGIPSWVRLHAYVFSNLGSDVREDESEKDWFEELDDR